MTVGVVRTTWSGTSGGPGLTQFVISGSAGALLSTAAAQSAVDAVRAFWDSIRLQLPNELLLTVSPVVDQYDQGTGYLTNTVTAPTSPPTVTGGSTATYAAGAGARINWRTTVIRDGKRVYGRTYIVPIQAGAYDATGLLTVSATDALKTAGQNLVTTLSAAQLGLQVWSRPSATGTPDGAIAGVTAVDVGRKTAILRSRRD